MLKGLNSDIVAQEKKFHVQTEDWGAQNPFLVTRVFCEGAVIETFKTSYQDLLISPRFPDENSLRRALHEQHHRMVDKLLSGKKS